MSLRCSPLSWRCLSFTNNYKVPLTPKRTLLSCANLSSSYAPTSSGEIPLLGVEDDFVGYLFGKKKATDVAHSVWKHVVRRGDTVVDATCGNGYDTLEMAKLVADESSAKGGGVRVYGMDIQKDALANTRQMLSESLSPNEESLVQLFPVCHSKMEEVVPKDASVRLVAFNLGYLPGGDKAITTMSETTRLALESATRIIGSGGLISVIVYVGHPTGREEFETVQGFASGLSTDDWICSKLQMMNRPLAPVPIFMFRR